MNKLKCPYCNTEFDIKPDLLKETYISCINCFKIFENPFRKTMKEVDTIQKPKEKYILKQIATRTDTAIKLNDGSNEVFTEKELLLEILNKLDQIEKSLYIPKK